MKPTPHPRSTIRRAAGAALAVVIAALMAACGGGSTPANGTGSPAASASSAFEQALSLARCFRTHGLPDYPDPESDGSFPSTAPHDIPPSAARACGSLIGAAKQGQTAKNQQDYPKELQVARCIRAHGYPTFPDPPPPGSQSQASGAPPGIDVNSPQFQAVQSSCNQRYFGTSTAPGAVAPTANG